MGQEAIIDGNLINDDRPLAVEQQGAIAVQEPVTIDGDVDIHVEGVAPKMDGATSTLSTTTYPHHEIHSGSAFAVHHYELDFDKASEIGVLFTTSNTAKWVHVIVLVDVATKALFEILRAPTIDVGNYPAAFYVPRNRNENSANASLVSSVRAVPVVNQVSLKRKADVTPITVDGFVLHCEAFGGKKGKTQMSGVRDSEEYILLQNTTYYFRLKGDNTGDDNVAASMEITWYEHTSVA